MNNGVFWKILIVLTLIIVIISWSVSWFYRQQVHSPFEKVGQKEIALTIQSGENARLIAARLEEEGLISSSLWFRLYLKLSQASGKSLQAGQYRLVPPLSIAEIADLLQNGQFTQKLTFIEGWRREQYAVYLAQIFTPEFVQKFLDETQSLEGYLFPDTYLVEKNITPLQLLQLLEQNFNQKITPDLQAQFQAQGLDLSQAVILASIVEREARFPEDRPRVAGILIKRLQNNWPLEADATVQFALASANCQAQSSKLKTQNLEECNWWPNEITQSDLEIESLYNTRQNPGLPPKPISNPGLAALQAVAQPQATNYWYYLSDAQGRMHYAATLEEHNLNIQKYLR